MEAPNSWYFLNSGPGAPAYNLALDDALLEASPSLGRPILRFYGWTEPAASFGYFQKYSEVARWTLLRPLVRRPTGGGLVPHDSDWTYSAAFPPSDPWYSLKAVESYRRIHEWIQSAFLKLGFTTELAPCSHKNVPGQCFEGCEKSDVLWHERKIAGAAQRRTRDGLLIQGSVQPPPIKTSRLEWERAMLAVAETNFRIVWQELVPGEDLARRAKELTERRYSRPEHNERK